MLDIVQNHCSSTPCDSLSRRGFLRAGTLGLAGLSLPALRAEEAGELLGRKTRAKAVVLVFLGGGLSHLDSFDPKPKAPVDVRGKYAAIDTAVPGLKVSEKLPLTARVMDRLTLVRSGTHLSEHHETATNWVLSGRLGSPFGDFPAVGSVVANTTGFAGKLPPYVAVPRNPSFTWELGKASFLGERCESIKAGDPNSSKYPVQGNNSTATQGEFQARARDKVLSAEARRAFAIEREPESLRDRYGRTMAGQSMLLARRLVEHGVKFVTVSYDGWDHHAGIFDGLDKKLPEFDRAFSTLVSDMDTRGLLEETLLVVMGEFGRTPKMNKEGGRDHWGQAASLLFAGASVKRGFVLGKTDPIGAFPTEQPIGPADVVHTIFAALGIDARKQLRTAEGRPFKILDQGRVIEEILG